MTSRFKGSQKDFADVISLLQAVGIKPGDSVLDYGANWGYGTWQFTAAGYRAVGYEISKARAEFGANLGLKIETDKARIVGLFDAVYSGHVLEHVPNPISAVREQLQWTRRGGYVIAHTPNGSLRRRELDFKSVHKNWGQVHPFLLTETFVTRNFGQSPLFVSSTGNEEEVQHWDNDSVYVGKTGGSTLLFILKKA
jgi:2-polyprenyl-3-methyl-5-hydroxy-6-metoxy-1,4-benzoquinol methylase